MNPIERARRKLGLSRTDFAVAAGVSYSEIFRAETGQTRTLNPDLAGFLRELKSLDDPKGTYLRWRESHRAAIMKRLNPVEKGEL